MMRWGLPPARCGWRLHEPRLPQPPDARSEAGGTQRRQRGAGAGLLRPGGDLGAAGRSARICIFWRGWRAACLWVGAVLAALLSLDRLFQGDFEDGSLDLIALSPLSLEQVALAKIPGALAFHRPAAHFAVAAAGAVVQSAVARARKCWLLSLLIGTPAVSAVGAIGASLTLSLKRGGLILPLLILPLLTPAVIFGAGAVSAALDGLANGALGLLAAFPRPRSAVALCRRRLCAAQSRGLGT